MLACTLEPSGRNETLRRRASHSGCSPNDTILPAPAARAARLSRRWSGLSRLITAAPSGSSPRKISALASAIASTESKNSRCTGSPPLLIREGGAARREPEKNLGLGVGDRLDRVEKFEMHRLDRRNDRDVRPDQPRSLRRS